MKLIHLLSAASIFVLAGCQGPNAVISSTQTVLGVSVQENPSTQLYEARAGYARNEFAFVPGNTNDPASVPNVIMELRVNNLFAGGMIYQRLAIGQVACAQPGASLMFSKDASGNIVPAVVQQLQLHKP